MWGKFLFFKKKIKMHFFLHEYNHIQYRNEILKKKCKKIVGYYGNGRHLGLKIPKERDKGTYGKNLSFPELS